MLRWEDRGEARWIHLEGELDYDGCAEVGDNFRDVVRSGPEEIVVDLARVSFVASQGIRLFLATNRQLRDEGRSLSLCGMNPHVRKVLETTGLFHAIPEYKG